MKKILFFLLLSTPILCFSQSNLNSLKLGALIGTPFYSSNNHFGASLQYDRIFSKRFTGSLATCFLASNQEIFIYGNYTPELGDQRFVNKERTFLSDIKLSYAIFRTTARNNLKIGAGISFAHVNFDYHLRFFILEDDLSSIEYDIIQSNLLMYNISIDYEFSISEHFFLALSGVLRKTFEEQDERLLMEVTRKGNAFSSSSTVTLSQGFYQNATFSIGVGYRF